MKLILALAWRNLWRNKRRTWTTISSILFAVLLGIVTRSMQEGSYGHMIRSSVDNSTGWIQIHKKGYWEEQILDKSMDATDLKANWASIKNVKTVVPRLESFALASHENKMQGVLLTGIDPILEKKFTNPEKNLIEGSMLHEGDSSILVAQGLANYLGLKIGDTLALIGQGYHAISAAGLFQIKGILKFGNPGMNKQFIYTTIDRAQNFYATGNRITSLCFSLNSATKLDETIFEVKKEVDLNKYEVLSWKEMLKELVQQIESDRGGGVLMIGVLYVIVGFGIFGTCLMMLLERKKEFAVLMALGMRISGIFKMIFIEIMFIGFIGLSIGVLIASPIIIWYTFHPIQLTGETAEVMINFGVEPIMPFTIDSIIFIEQLIVVQILVLGTLILPFWVLNKFNITKGLHG